MRRLVSLLVLPLMLTAAAVHADEKSTQVNVLVERSWGLIAQHKSQEAIAPLEQALAIAGDPAEPSPLTAYVLKALGTAYLNTGKMEKAEISMLRAVEIEKSAFGENDVRDMEGLGELGGVYATQGKYDKAEIYFRKALAIADAKLPPDSPMTGACLDALGRLLNVMGRTAEAKPLLDRAAAINSGHS